MYDRGKKISCNAFLSLGLYQTKFIYVDATTHAYERRMLRILNYYYFFLRNAS